MTTEQTPSPEQLPLTLPHLEARGVEDFFISPANEAAVAWIHRWPDWPGGILVLHGPAGAGKSHLASLWADRAQATEIAAKDLSDDHVTRLRQGERLVLDAADDVESDAAQTRLFHLVNSAREMGESLLLVARRPVARWPVTLLDLNSRLRAMPQVAIGEPDDSLMAAVLVKQFADRQIRVSPDLTQYLVTRLDRSFAALRQAVESLDRAALAEGRPVTVPLARKILGLS